MVNEYCTRYRCALCDEVDYRQVCKKDTAQYVQCSQCGVVRQHPYPSADEIIAHYERYQSLKSEQSTYLSNEGFAAFKRDKAFTFADLRLPPDGFQGKRILDVGCATGQFLQMMNDARAAQVLGIDVSPECISTAQAQGLPCLLGDFMLLDGQFDLITMWHVIEHLPRPQDYIQHAHKLMPTGGWLLIETPVIGMISEAFGAQWRYFMPTEHINLFPIDALIQLCNGVGFALQGQVRFGSGNTSEVVPSINKLAMDALAKKAGFGDTLALWMVKT
ncbi:MAG: class I SAM-dependent methyltransferase [Porticoccaceae bacterium]|nr:class I SAM-dependent methyltransferase [Porticoccaceae bacterium]